MNLNPRQQRSGRDHATVSSLSLCGARGEGRGEGFGASAFVAAPLIRPSATCSPRSAKGAGSIRTQLAFTMVEVALSLAIVAFAMVAIIGVMPAGLNVQKENRDDTVLSQDSSMILEAIRGGESSSNLTALSTALVGPIYGVNLSTYPSTNSPLDIVKRLSIPAWDTSGFTTGATVAVSARFRAMSGGLGDTAGSATNMAFTYYVQVQITRFNPDPYTPFYNPLATNLHELKLTFQWPVYDDPGITTPPTRVGNRQLILRSLISGQLVNWTNGGYFFRTESFNAQ